MEEWRSSLLLWTNLDSVAVRVRDGRSATGTTVSRRAMLAASWLTIVSKQKCSRTSSWLSSWTKGSSAARLPGPGARSPGPRAPERPAHPRACPREVAFPRGALVALLGDDASETLAGAPCALAVSPKGHKARPGELRQIGVGYHATLRVRRRCTPPESWRSTARPGSAPCGSSRGKMFVSVHRSPPTGPRPPRRSSRSIGSFCRPRRELRAQSCSDGPREELSRFSQELDLLVVGSRSQGTGGQAGPRERLQLSDPATPAVPCSCSRVAPLRAGRRRAGHLQPLGRPARCGLR